MTAGPPPAVTAGRLDPGQSNLPPGDQAWWRAYRDRVERAAQQAAQDSG